ncbi:hypothetical protein AGMMS50229_18610 [Campylobacterota bacterium]|nr:hypothetical protein AGMMS50229_18610 [Campylobacterota bacterium]
MPSLQKRLEGESSDFEKPLTREDINAYADSVRRFDCCNTVELTASIRGLYLSPAEPKPRLDPETKLPKLDPNGEIIYWPQRHYAKLAFEGGEMDTEVQATWNLKIGDKKKFVGSLGLINRFGENVIGAVFRAIEEAPKL